MFCAEIAQKFEEQYDPECGDYYGEIDAFASEWLIREYGVNREPEPDYIKSDEVYVRSMHDICYLLTDNSAFTHCKLLATVHGDEELCQSMFLGLQGETPEEYIQHQLSQGYWTKCNACGRFFDSDLRKDPSAEIIECPICHTPLPDDEPFDVAVDRELGYL